MLAKRLPTHRLFQLWRSAVGEAQTSPLATLCSATTQSVEVTILNVKQTKEGIRLVVALTGERYNY